MTAIRRTEDRDAFRIGNLLRRFYPLAQKDPDPRPCTEGEGTSASTHTLGFLLLAHRDLQ